VATLPIERPGIDLLNGAALSGNTPPVCVGHYSALLDAIRARVAGADCAGAIGIGPEIDPADAGVPKEVARSAEIRHKESICCPQRPAPEKSKCWS
jgi:hypothetical protein